MAYSLSNKCHLFVNGQFNLSSKTWSCFFIGTWCRMLIHVFTWQIYWTICLKAWSLRSPGSTIMWTQLNIKTQKWRTCSMIQQNCVLASVILATTVQTYQSQHHTCVQCTNLHNHSLVPTVWNNNSLPVTASWQSQNTTKSHFQQINITNQITE